MAGRTGNTYTTPKGVVNTKKKTYTGKGPAPAGTKKVAEPSYTEVPTVTVSNDGSVSTSGFSSQQAARRAQRAQKARSRRVRRIINQTKTKPQKLPAPKPYTAPKIKQERQSIVKAINNAKPIEAPKPPAPTQPAKQPVVKSPQVATAVMSSTPGLGPKVTKQRRQAARTELQKAKKAVRKSQGASRGHLRSEIVQTPEQSKIAKTVLRVGEGEGASRKEKLAALTTGLQETGFRNLAVGDNFTKEPAGGWRGERIEYYKDPLNVKEAAKEFYREAKDDTHGMRGRGESIGDFAQTIQQSAYEGDSTYGRHIPEAKQLLRQYNRGKADPKAVQRLQKAVKEAKSLGMKVGKPTPDLAPAGKFVKVRADAKGMVQWVRANLGTNEGTPKTMKWGASYGLNPVSQPWCANFVSNGLARRGVPLPPNPNYVPSYEHEWSGGRNIGTDLSKAKPGDLITYSGEHIAVYVGGGKAIGGNQSDSVTEGDAVSLSSHPISMILRPNYKGGFVKVKETSPLVGSTAVTGSVSGSSAPAAAGLVASPGEEKKPRLTTAQRVARTNRKLKSLGVGVSSTKTSQSSTAVLDELAKKYGVAA